MRSEVVSVPFAPPPRHRGLHGFLGVHPALVTAVGCLLAVPPFASGFWTFEVMAGLVVAISCLGLLVLAGWAREISLMQAGLTGAALVVCTDVYRPYLPDDRVWSFPLAAAWATGFVVAVSFVTALVSARLAGPYVIVLTLSIQFWLENAIVNPPTPLRTGPLVPPTPRPDFFGLSLQEDHRFYYLIAAVLLVVMVFLHRARNSRFGRAMIMAGSDPVAAASVGISPWRYRVWAFVVAGALAGLAGALSGPLYISPPGSLHYISFNSIFYLAVPVIAGFDSIAGTVAVALVLTLIPQVVVGWKLNVYLLGGVGMAAGAFLGPRGLSGLIADTWRRDAI